MPTTGSKPTTASSNTGCARCAGCAPTEQPVSSSLDTPSSRTFDAATTNWASTYREPCGSPQRLPNSPRRSDRRARPRYTAPIGRDNATAPREAQPRGAHLVPQERHLIRQQREVLDEL